MPRSKHWEQLRMRVKNVFHMFFSAPSIVIRTKFLFWAGTATAEQSTKERQEMFLTEIDRLFRQSFACSLAYNDSYTSGYSIS